MTSTLDPIPEQSPQFEVILSQEKKGWYISYEMNLLKQPLYVFISGTTNKPSDNEVEKVLVFIANNHKYAQLGGPKNISLNYFDGLLDDKYKELTKSTLGKVSEVMRPRGRGHKVTF